jgi:hypothetical protein
MDFWLLGDALFFPPFAVILFWCMHKGASPLCLFGCHRNFHSKYWSNCLDLDIGKVTDVNIEMHCQCGKELKYDLNTKQGREYAARVELAYATSGEYLRRRAGNLLEQGEVIDLASGLPVDSDA